MTALIQSMAKEKDLEQNSMSIDDAVLTIRKAIDRKEAEVAALEKSKSRFKKESRIAETQALIDYLRSDIRAYRTVIADMTGDDSVIEGIDDDDESVPAPENYQKYIDGLSVDDLENEQEAESVRAEYCDGIIQEMCISIGKSALGSKKMLKILLDDPYALECIGELIWNDDYLYDEVVSTIQSEKSSKKKKKKKD